MRTEADDVLVKWCKMNQLNTVINALFCLLLKYIAIFCPGEKIAIQGTFTCFKRDFV